MDFLLDPDSFGKIINVLSWGVTRFPLESYNLFSLKLLCGVWTKGLGRNWGQGICLAGYCKSPSKR